MKRLKQLWLRKTEKSIIFKIGALIIERANKKQDWNGIKKVFKFQIQKFPRRESRQSSLYSVYIYVIVRRPGFLKISGSKNQKKQTQLL